MSIKFEYINKIIDITSLVVLEIGSNIGNDSQKFLDLFSDIELYCFEPDPRCIEKFKRHINDNRCSLFEVAVGDIDGYLDFYMSGGSKPGHKTERINSSSLLEPKTHLKKHPWCIFDKTCKVQVVRLDTWSEQNDIDHIDFIWADVQGAEQKLIEGGLETLKKAKFFYTEFSNEELYKGQIGLDSILSLLPNFKIKKLYKSNVLLENLS